MQLVLADDWKRPITLAYDAGYLSGQGDALVNAAMMEAIGNFIACSSVDEELSSRGQQHQHCVHSAKVRFNESTHSRKPCRAGPLGKLVSRARSPGKTRIKLVLAPSLQGGPLDGTPFRSTLTALSTELKSSVRG
jgi:hypothetical protein